MTDVAALGYRIDASQAAEAARELDRMSSAAKRADASAENLERSARSTGQALTTAAGQADAFRAQMGGAQGSLGNMAAQFNDIGVMLAAGQSPLILALQQGTQINQAFDAMGQAGATATGRIAALRAAFASVISPANLLTIGIIAGGVALAQWAMGAISASRETNAMIDPLERAEEAASTLLETYQRIEDLDFTQVAESARVALEEFAPLIDFLREEALSNLQGQINEVIRTSGIIEAVNETQQEFEGILQILDNLEGEASAAFDPQVLSQYNSAIAEQEAMLDAVGLRLNSQQVALGEILGIAGETREEYLRQAQAVLETLESANMLDDATRAALLNIINAIDPTAVLRDTLREAANAAGDISANLPSNITTSGVGPGLSDNVLNNLPPARRVSSGGGGGGGVDPFQANLDRLIESLRTEREILDANYEENMALLNDRRALEILGEEEHRQALLRVEEQYQADLAAIRGEGHNQQLSDSADFFGALASVAQAGGERANRVAQTLGAVQATINAWIAYTEVLRDPAFIGRPFARFAAAARVLAAGLGAVRAIRGAGGGGGATSAPTAAGSTVEQTPERRVLIDLQGPDWARGILQPLMEQIYEATRDGERVVFAR